MSLSSLPPTWKDEGSFESTVLEQGLHSHFNMKPNFLGAMRTQYGKQVPPWMDPPWIYRLGGEGGGLWQALAVPFNRKTRLSCDKTRDGAWR